MKVESLWRMRKYIEGELWIEKDTKNQVLLVTYEEDGISADIWRTVAKIDCKEGKVVLYQSALEEIDRLSSLLSIKVLKNRI